MLMLPPLNLELLSTETNRAARVHAHTRTGANTLVADLLDSESAALVSDVCCKRTGYRVRRRKKKKNKERSERVRGEQEEWGKR